MHPIQKYHQKVKQIRKRLRKRIRNKLLLKFIIAFWPYILAAIGILVGAILLLIIIITIIGAIMSAGGGCSGGNSSSDVSSTITGTAGDWTTKGTKNYNGAKNLYAVLKGKGANDTQAAGVVGALAHEGGGQFGIPDIAQSWYAWTSKPTEANAGISSPGVASKAASATPGGARSVGASTFQYTPYTKFAPASDKSKWRSYKALTDYWFKSQVPTMHESLSDLKKCSSLSEAVQWTLNVEEGHGSQNAFSDRLSKARQAYKAFNGVGGSASDASNTADAGDSSSGGSSSCGSSDDNDSSLSGIIKFALKFKHKIPYGTADRQDEPKYLKQGHAHGEDDCSGFVWAVLKALGYKTPSTVWTTYSQFPSHYATKVGTGNDKSSWSKTQAGDIANTLKGPDGGHMIFLAEKYHGSSTKIVEEGGSFGNVGEETIGECDTYVSPSDWTFYKPEK